VYYNVEHLFFSKVYTILCGWMSNLPQQEVNIACRKRFPILEQKIPQESVFKTVLSFCLELFIFPSECASLSSRSYSRYGNLNLFTQSHYASQKASPHNFDCPFTSMSFTFCQFKWSEQSRMACCLNSEWERDEETHTHTHTHTCMYTHSHIYTHLSFYFTVAEENLLIHT